MQQRICDCWLRAGGCFCELKPMENEGKPTDTDGKNDSITRGKNKRPDSADSGHKKPLSGDARDLEKITWLPDSPRSTEGRYENRFWGDDE